MDALWASLSEGCERVASNQSLGLDEVRARQLLGLMRLEDPRHYVLELVQVASMLGATAVDIELETHVLRFQCDGEGFDGEALEGLYAAVFRVRSSLLDDAMRHLALAMGSAQCLGVSRVVLDSVTVGGEGWRLFIQGEGNGRVWSQGEPGEDSGLHLEVRQKVQWRHVGELWERMMGRQVEVQVLRERCRFARFDVCVDGVVVSKGHYLEGEYDVVLGEDGGVHDASGVMGVCVGVKRASRVIWVRHGVVIEVEEEMYDWGCMEAVIEVPELKLDLALGGVIKGEVWADVRRDVVMGLLHEGLGEVLAQGMEHEVNKGGTYFDGRLDVNVFKRIAWCVLRQSGDGLRDGVGVSWRSEEVLRLIEGVKLWPVADRIDGVEAWEKALVSLSELGVGFERRDNRLMVSADRKPVRLEGEDAHVLWVRGYDRDRPLEKLRAYLPGLKVVDVSEELERERVRQKNYMAWASRGFMGRLRKDRYGVQLTQEVHGGLGAVELGIYSGGRMRAECVFAPGGRMLKMQSLQDVVPVEMTFIWRGDLVPTWLHDDVERDEVFWAFARVSVELWLEGVKAWARGLEGSVGQGVKKSLRLSVLAWVEGSLPERVFKALGLWSGEHVRGLRAWEESDYGQGIFGFARYREQLRRSDLELVRCRELLGELGRIGFYEDLKWDEVSLSQMIESVFEDGQLAVVMEDEVDEARRHYRYAESDRLVVVLTDELWGVLRVVCGADRLLRYGEILRDLASKKKFMRQPEEEAVLGRRAVSVVRFDCDGVCGEVGLMAEQRMGPGSCDVRVLYLGRCVAQFSMVVPCGTMRAVVSCERLKFRRGWEDVDQRDESYQAMLEVLRGRIERLYGLYLSEMEEEYVSVDRRKSWFEMACYLGGVAGRGELGDRFARVFEGMCIWRMRGDGGDVRVMGSAGVKEVIGEGYGELMYAEQAQLGEDIEGNVLFVPSGVKRVDQALMMVFSDVHRVVSVVDVKEEGERVLRAREEFLSRSEVEVSLQYEEGEYLVVRSFAGRGYRGVVGMREDMDAIMCRGRAQVRWLQEGRDVMWRGLESMLGMYEVVVDVDALVNWEKSDRVDVEVLREYERLVLREVRRAFDMFCEGVGCGDVSASRVRRMVSQWLWQLRAGRGDSEWYEALKGVAVYEAMWSGERVSVGDLVGMDEVYVTDDRSLDGWVYGELGEVLYVAGEEEKLAMEGAIFPARVVDVREVERKNRPLHGGDFGEEQISGVDGEKVFDSEVYRGLGERIVDVLDEICGERMYLRESERLWRVDVGAVELGGEVATAREDGVWCDGLASVVRKANAEWSGQRGVLGVLVGVVYSAINRYEEETTDKHEEEFLNHLAVWMNR